MAEGRGRNSWMRTSWLCYVVYSMVAGSKGKKLTPDDFNPIYGAKENDVVLSRENNNFNMLKSMLGVNNARLRREGNENQADDADERQEPSRPQDGGAAF